MWGAIYQRLQEHPFITGWLGSITTLSASAVSMLQQLELVLRVVSLGLGVFVGVLTAVITWRKIWEKGPGSKVESSED